VIGGRRGRCRGGFGEAARGTLPAWIAEGLTWLVGEMGDFFFLWGFSRGKRGPGGGGPPPPWGGSGLVISPAPVETQRSFRTPARAVLASQTVVGVDFPYRVRVRRLTLSRFYGPARRNRISKNRLSGPPARRSFSVHFDQWLLWKSQV